MTVITLTTDFGTGDYEAGVLKGVIWRIAPEIQIADLSHDIAAHDIMQAALTVWRAAPFFPDHSIHVVVVDPGVGTSRRGLAALIGSQYFVGPDNGLATLLLDQAESAGNHTHIVHLDRPEYWLTDVSNVFHGRDIFAPVAAHLARGISLDKLGTRITDPVRLSIPKAEPIPGGWQGRVINVDHFGNLATNLTARQIPPSKEVMVRIKGFEIKGLVSAFGECPKGTLVALLDSSNSLAISVVNGNAAQFLDAEVGTSVEIRFTEKA